jgi:hypothetical protein
MTKGGLQMKKLLGVLSAAIAVVAVSAQAHAGVKRISSLPDNLGHVPMAGADFPGAPPPFDLPGGGWVTSEALGGSMTRFTLYRSSGVKFAYADAAMDGTVEHALFYDSSGKPTVSTTADYSPRGGSSFSSLHQQHPDRSRRRSSDCGSGNWAWLDGGKWDPYGTWHWYFVSGSTPYWLNVDNTETAMRNAHSTWGYNTNRCGVPDAADLSISYSGRIGSAFGYNGYSTVGFGDTNAVGCANAAACTANFYGPYSTIYYAESDQRFSVDVPWINGQAAGKADVQSTAVHETGHSVGLGHNYSGCCNVMDQHPIVFNTITDRILGLGDAWGNNTIN